MEITKTCTKCKEEKPLFLFNKRKNGVYPRCKECCCIILYELRQRPGQKEKHTLYSIEYRKKNPELTKSCSKKYRRNNKEKLNIKSKKYNAIIRNELGDSYVKLQLTNQGFLKDQITPELIELKRIMLKTKRLCQQLQN